ncbi:MAG: aminomethyl-transferring glycine dehydrogenase subunit GcvPA [Pseudomonadota bacterium]
MPFIPHTETDIREMLDTIGAESIDELFDEIPESLRIDGLEGVPSALNEMQVTRLMHERAAQDHDALSFIGAGAYEHHIPALVWQLTTRGEYYSAYTPYQAEASQGTLQVIYEYQSMIASLTGMEVSNASLYDGASAVAEAALMAVRANRKSKSRRVVFAGGTSRTYQKVAQAIAGTQGLLFDESPLDSARGIADPAQFLAGEEPPVAVVIQQPNFLGNLEEVDALTDAAHAVGALVVAVVNPTSLALIRPPGEWGEKGADIVCGEGQPLGVPLSSGGPYFGFMTTRAALVRQLPGRIVGRTVDVDGKSGFTLTLQAREQHIRRSKATSNICTNQGLMVTAATMYLAVLGEEGLARVAAASHRQTRKLVSALTSVRGVERAYDTPFFHEAVLRLDRPAADVLARLAEHDVLGGLDLSADHPELGNALLVCATETKTDEDIERYRALLAEVMNEQGSLASAG